MEAGSINIPDYKTCASRPDVQTQTAIWSQLISLASSIPAFLLIPLMGRLVDRWGRKTMLVMFTFTAILDSVSVLAVGNWNLSLWLLVFSNLIQGVMGGYVVLVMAAYAFIADTSTLANRTQTFLALEILTFVSLALGPYFGGLLYRKTGLLTVYTFSLVLDVAAVLYFIFLVPESFKPNLRTRRNSTTSLATEGSPTTRDSETGVKSLWKHFSKSWKSSLNVLKTPGRGKSLMMLVLISATSSMAAAGYEFTFFYYPAQKFGWDAYDAGFYSMCKSFCRLFYLSLVLPALLKWFATSSNLVTKTRRELGLIRYAYFIFSFGLICHGLATEGWMFFPLLIFYTGGSMARPTIRGIASRSISESSQGALFAAFELLQNGTSLISELFIPAIYRAFVQMDTPEYMFFVQAGFWAVALWLTVYLKSRELVGIQLDVHSEEETQDEEEEAFLPPSERPHHEHEYADLESADSSVQSLRRRVRGATSASSLRSRFGGRRSSISASLFFREEEEGSEVGSVVETIVSRWVDANSATVEGLEYAVEEISRERTF
ncbi:hypothetical protein HDU98_007327 [Podochytrium sp. JEL0797]|nr:hypothetical protein HDU98_007327 [Podochytrium sp. JEL0797]